jgi:hypothetical protein
MIKVKEFCAPKVNMKEILRYAGDKEIESIALECIADAEKVLSYRVCYSVVNVSVNGEEVDMEFTRVHSKDLAKNLSGCNKAVVFAATVGIGIDRLISKYVRVSPSRAFCFQAVGSERVETLCDEFENEVKKELLRPEMFSRPRFSPGYGDLSLEIQKEIFALLDCPRKIGVSLGDSLLMTPSKSVTAIMGYGTK